jgi:UPF0716 family protein affecting phage T7 exclusion
MITVILCIISFVAGMLVYRKHAEKLKAAEQKAKDAADALR